LLSSPTRRSSDLHRRCAEFKEELACISGWVRLGFRAWNLQPFDCPNRQILNYDGFLGHRVDEPRRDNLDLIHFALQKKLAGKRRNRTRLVEARRVTERELRDQLPAG